MSLGSRDFPKPFIAKGDVITAEKLQLLADASLHELPPNAIYIGGKLVFVRTLKPKGTTAVTAGGSSTRVDVVLIDKDIDPGISEVSREITTDIVELTPEELADDPPWTVVLQDPPWTVVDALKDFGYTRASVSLKRYERAKAFWFDTAQDFAGDPNQIKLESISSDLDDFYVGSKIEIIAGAALGDIRTVTAYDGTTKVATVDTDWTTAPDHTSDYEIDDPGQMQLAIKVVDDEVTHTKMVNYDYINVWYDDGKPFLVGNYQRSDFPDYPENAEFPGDIPEELLKRKFRGIVIGGVLITALCKALPPPDISDYVPS